MGKEKEPVIRVVLDTNVLVSALLFRGEPGRLIDLWKSGRIVPVVSKATFDEFRAVLAYPKFKLTAEEIRAITEEDILPFFEVVVTVKEVQGVCRDPEDDKFIACALAASVRFIVSGDKDLCDIAKYRSVRIMRVSELLRIFD